MKATFSFMAASLLLVSVASAETCREVVRDASGRVTQTIDHQKSGNGTVRSVIRDASGRMIGTSTSQTSGTTGSRTDFRDASGRSTGNQTTNGSSGFATGTRRDASGRVTGTSTGSGSCPTNPRIPIPPTGAKK